MRNWSLTVYPDEKYSYGETQLGYGLQRTSLKLIAAIKD